MDKTSLFKISDIENAYVLDSQESYDELGQNVKKYENMQSSAAFKIII